MPSEKATVLLIPCSLYEGVIETIPPYVLSLISSCEVFFVENERTARRFLKSVWKEMVIDDYEWHTIHKAEKEVMPSFVKAIQSGRTVGILSEAGVPGIADPGQLLIGKAQELGAIVRPLVGPSSILLALMASGFNGQQFRFRGYLPIDSNARKKMIQQMEQEVLSKEVTQIFIETPFRNDALLKDVMAMCRPETKLCIAVDITAADEMIATKKMKDWQASTPDLHKRPAIFLMGI